MCAPENISMSRLCLTQARLYVRWIAKTSNIISHNVSPKQFSEHQCPRQMNLQLHLTLPLVTPLYASLVATARNDNSCTSNHNRLFLDWDVLVSTYLRRWCQKSLCCRFSIAHEHLLGHLDKCRLQDHLLFRRDA